MALGIDTVFIPRFYGKEKLAKRILSSEEYAIYEHRLNKEEFLAGRFAAKEAFLKAFRNGIGRISVTSISIVYGEDGRPVLMYNEQFYNVSISHDGDYAVAVVEVKE